MLPSTTIALVERLSSLLPDEFSQRVLNGSLRALQDDNNPIRVNLFALGIREMVRHVLDEKAPEAEIRRCRWFKEAMERKLSKASVEERRTLDIITRKDRMVFATQGGLQDELLKRLNIDTDGMHSALLATVNKLSKYVHIQPANMLPPFANIVPLADEVLTTVSEFLEAIASFRTSVGDAVSDAVYDGAFNLFLMETVDSLDVLSTHTQVDEIVVDEINVKTIGASEVILEASGTVYVELVYGSASDERRGDGARMSGKYPFTMTFSASADTITPLERIQFNVNTDSFYE